MDQAFYQGYALNAVDAKNRLSVPADFRAVVQARSGTSEILVGPGHGDVTCLMAYDRSHAARLMAAFESRNGATMDRAAYDEAEFLFGTAKSLTIDDAGRIVLPPGLQDLGGISRHVWFIAGFHWFEMWDPWDYLARPDLHPAKRKILLSELRQKGLGEERPA